VPTLSLILLWLLNGLLVLAYAAADHLLVLLLLPALIWLAGSAPPEQRPRQILIGGLPRLQRGRRGSQPFVFSAQSS
jgi:hypothetical protein